MRARTASRAFQRQKRCVEGAGVLVFARGRYEEVGLLRDGVRLPLDQHGANRVVAVDRQHVAVVEYHRSNVPADSVNPIAVGAEELEAVEFVAAIEIPGLAMVVTDQRVASAAATGQLALVEPARLDVVPHDERADQIAIGQTLQIGVMPPGFEQELQVRPGLAVVSGD